MIRRAVRIISVILGLMLPVPLFAQFKLKGVIRNADLKPVANAKVYFKEDFEFVYSDVNGNFQLPLTDTGSFIIVAELSPYPPAEADITIKELTHDLSVILSLNQKAGSVLKNVTVKAAVLSVTNDKAKSELFAKIDILTTAGSNADITSAFKTLPGTQQAVSEDGLFVRGGQGSETQPYIDGLRTPNFYYSGAPDISHRGRFPPSLFKGSFFASGGYSAQYGQALSSVIVLETEGLPASSSIDFNIGTVGAGASANMLSKNGRSSYGGSISYLNLRPYYSIIKQAYNFEEPPYFLDGSVFFRIKTGKKGLLKLYSSLSQSDLSLFRQNIDYDYRQDYYRLRNKNSYSNISYTSALSNNWSLESGGAWGQNRDIFRLGQVDSAITSRYKDSSVMNYSLQGRIALKKRFNNKLSLLTGTEYQYYYKKFDKSSVLSTAHASFSDNYAALFAEMNYEIADKLNARLGVRGEYSSVLNRVVAAPRAMMDYNFYKNYHLSFSYGQFYQKPEEDMFFFKQDMRFLKSTHYILGLQKLKTNSYTLRVEAYYKKYDRLTLFTPDTTQDGYGYARGIEFFWRKKINEKSMEYWISYSYLDSKRKFWYYPVYTQPGFVSNHAMSVVFKRYFNKISTHIAASYSFESGKPYYNPLRPSSEYLEDRTSSYRNLNLSVAYVRNIKKVYSIFVVTVSNVLNDKQVFGYRYSSVDINKRQEVKPLAGRFIFIGAFFSLGIDRTEDAFNRSL